MIAIDTNVLVRFLTQDDANQFLQAKRLFKHHCTPQSPGWISVIVICELVWVLQRTYRYSRENIAIVLNQLLRTAELEIEDSDLAKQALERFASGKYDFADALIGLRNERAGASPTYTFDRTASTLPEFRLATGK